MKVTREELQRLANVANELLECSGFNDADEFEIVRDEDGRVKIVFEVE